MTGAVDEDEDEDEGVCRECGASVPPGCTIPDLAMGPRVYCPECCPRCNPNETEAEASS